MIQSGFGPRERRRMTTRLLLWFVLAIFLGSVVVYLRLWIIDSAFSREDRELLRRQFDRANMEALDESAQWRSRYDQQVDRTNQIQRQLSQTKDSLVRANEKLEDLQKEKVELQKQVERLKSYCNCSLLTQTS